MTNNVIVDGISVDILQQDLAAGKQGKVHLAALSSDPGKRFILKEMPNQPSAWERVHYLASVSIPALSTGLAGPIAAELGGDGMIRHLSPYVEGQHLENLPAVSLPQNLEMALELVTNAAVLEEHGLCHGDIAESNVMFGTNGSVSFIDVDGFASSDPTVPVPLTLGQHHMLAPELRTNAQPHPTMYTDRFALAVFLNTLCLSRHTVHGLANTPAEVDAYMSSGLWPERSRFRDAAETPIEALGERLMDLFDRAFLLDATFRPSPDEWRAALIDALDNCWIHDCGNAFVANANTSQCPFCGQPVTIPESTLKLYVTIVADGSRCAAELKDRQTIVLGRATLPNMPQSVSFHHLEITQIGDQLFLRHRGSNPTLIELRGQWYQFNEHWVSKAEAKGLRLMLAEAELELFLT